MRSKKGVMGLDTAKMFVVGILTLIIVGVLALVLLVQINNTSLIPSDTNIVTNETGYVNSTGYTLTFSTTGINDSFALTALYNRTSGLSIPLGNATVSAEGLVTNATEVNWNNVSISYTYQTYSDTEHVIMNGTSGLSNFFSNTSVWLSLLGILIIILIISAVVVVVNRFGGGSTQRAPTL